MHKHFRSDAEFCSALQDSHRPLGIWIWSDRWGTGHEAQTCKFSLKMSNGLALMNLAEQPRITIMAIYRQFWQCECGLTLGDESFSGSRFQFLVYLISPPYLHNINSLRSTGYNLHVVGLMCYERVKVNGMTPWRILHVLLSQSYYSLVQNFHAWRSAALFVDMFVCLFACLVVGRRCVRERPVYGGSQMGQS